LVRFALGIGEAVALPCFNRTVANWMPAERRGIGIGLAIGGIGLGSAMTPPLAAFIMVNWGWQIVFYLSGAIGILTGLFWWWLSRDRPEEHPWIQLDNMASTGRDEPPTPVVPWRTIALTPTVWWLVMSYSCLGYVAYLYLSWFYLYLVNVRGFDILRGGLYASTPFWAILISCPLGGWVTDRLAAKHGITRGRAMEGENRIVLTG